MKLETQFGAAFHYNPFGFLAPFCGQCPNCGMVRAMWARTWFTFENSAGPSRACSLHCLADIARKSGEKPGLARVARYLEPEQMISASKAFFVVGSKARGTMTMQSKPAFASRREAESFAGQCGGKVIYFNGAMAAAAKTVGRFSPSTKSP